MIKSVINFDLVRYAEYDDSVDVATFFFTIDDYIIREGEQGRKTFHSFSEYMHNGCNGHTPHTFGVNEPPKPVAAGTPAKKDS